MGDFERTLWERLVHFVNVLWKVLITLTIFAYALSAAVYIKFVVVAILQRIPDAIRASPRITKEVLIALSKCVWFLITHPIEIVLACFLSVLASSLIRGWSGEFDSVPDGHTYRGPSIDTADSIRERRSPAYSSRMATPLVGTPENDESLAHIVLPVLSLLNPAMWLSTFRNWRDTKNSQTPRDRSLPPLPSRLDRRPVRSSPSYRSSFHNQSSDRILRGSSLRLPRDFDREPKLTLIQRIIAWFKN